MQTKIFGLEIVQETLENKYSRSALQTQAHRYGEPKIEQACRKRGGTCPPTFWQIS